MTASNHALHDELATLRAEHEELKEENMLIRNSLRRLRLQLNRGN